ncbi:hypothetical protein [Flavobacterium sp.]|uniref:hypothetical protein n=1 Tax=Flavobacterium sp. TaxID=239 RepID=UPI0031D77837
MKKIIIIIIIFCLLSCNDKKTNHYEELNTKTFEKFDLKRFNDNKKDSTYEYFSKDTIIRLYEEKDHYRKELITDNYSFKSTFIYNKTTHLLLNQFSVFYGMPIRIWKKYDENGNLISIKDYDKGFDFTVNNLIVMLKKEFQIDLINDNAYQSLLISRSSYKRFYFINRNCYLIQISTISETRIMKIDGETGEIINDKTSFTEE